MRTLFVADPLVSGPRVIEGDEAHHARSVLRLSVGDRCRVVDGCGHDAEAEVRSCQRHHIDLDVAEVRLREPPRSHMLTVALAAPKGSRLDDVVRGLVELGVGGIVILGCERSSRLPQLDRLQRVAREALKQCRGCYLPEIRIEPDFTQWTPTGNLIVLDPKGGKQDIAKPEASTLVIGPEGGLTSDEEHQLLAYGASPLRLVSTILRIETAALAATAVMAHAWEHHD